MENKYKIPIIKIDYASDNRDEQIDYRNNLDNINFIQIYSHSINIKGINISYNRFIGKNDISFKIFGIGFRIIHKNKK